MTNLALGLVLVSALAHASWNFLLKRAATPEVFTWWLLVSIAVLLCPVGLVLAWRAPVENPGWWYVLGTILLHVLYFVFLGRSYTHADLSVVYPVARGLGPTLVPALGFLILDEKVAALAIVGIAGVVLGIYTVYWWGRMSQVLREPFKLLTERGSRYAVLTGLVIAAYSVWDKVGVRYVNPFLYMYLMALGTSIAMAPYMLRLHGRVAVRSELRVGSWSIVTAGMLTYLAYGLVLRALEFSKVSYIAPSREVGIVVGVLLGVLVLKEPFGRGRLFGSSLIVLGLGLIAAAP